MILQLLSYPPPPPQGGAGVPSGKNIFLDENRKGRFLADAKGMKLHDPALFIYSILYTCQEIKSSFRKSALLPSEKRNEPFIA
jgi:hypothetical protein